MNVLLVNSPPRILTDTAQILQAIGGRVTSANDYAAALRQAREEQVDAVVFAAPASDSSPLERSHYQDWLRWIETQRVAALLVADEEADASATSLVGQIPTNVEPGELRGRLATIDRYHRLVVQLENELKSMERLGKNLKQHFFEVDQEMRLAARLQRDFLPSLHKPIENVRFSAVYRPASWVSGDIYDVFRVDEEHVGFYVADAVGHGMAAALLTMFIKRAIIAKEIHENSYEILSPSQTLQLLNDALAEQALPNCQFVTCCYGLLNFKTLKLQFARGGHPYAMLVDRDARISELKAPGGLMGLFRGECFPTCETQLHPGEKLILFSDGVETAFQAEQSHSLDATAYRAAFEKFAGLPIPEMLLHLSERLDDESGSIAPRDDITLLGFEILRP